MVATMDNGRTASEGARAAAKHLVLHQDRQGTSFFFHECSDSRIHHIPGIGDVLSIIRTNSEQLEERAHPWKKFKYSLVLYGSEHPWFRQRVDRIRRRLEAEVQRVNRLRDQERQLRIRLATTSEKTRTYALLGRRIEQTQEEIRKSWKNCLHGGPWFGVAMTSTRQGDRYLSSGDLEVVGQVYFALFEPGQAPPGTIGPFRAHISVEPDPDEPGRTIEQVAFAKICEDEADYDPSVWEVYKMLHASQLWSYRETWVTFIQEHLAKRAPGLGERLTDDLLEKLVGVLSARVATANSERPAHENPATLAIAVGAEVLQCSREAIEERTKLQPGSVSSR